MSDLRELHYCLGVEFERNREACIIIMDHMNYIKEVFKRLSMEECKPIETPFDVNSKIFKLQDEEFVDVQREMEGVP
jgi:hypothetical protein